MTIAALAACSCGGNDGTPVDGGSGPGDGAGPSCTNGIALSEAAAMFTLPPGYRGTPGSNAEPPFSDLANNVGCGAGFSKPQSRVVELTGDGLLDLVFTLDCADPAVGFTKWLVHANTGTGFATTPTTFALPPGYRGTPGSAAEPPFSDLANNIGCGAGFSKPQSRVLDLTGDGLLDLVFTLDCADPAVGFTTWLVHANTGTGFATIPTTFALPPGYRGTPGSAAEPPFSDLANNVGCGAGFSKPQSRVLDLTGDGLPDLVFTLDCADPAVGFTKWLVHANTGTGFATTPTMFALPPGFRGTPGSNAEPPFSDLANSVGCGAGFSKPQSRVLDLTGDGLLDLVFTLDCADGAVGFTKWLVHANTGTGFATTPTTFALPPGYRGTPGSNAEPPFSDLANSVGCGAGFSKPQSRVLDLTGDGLLDLVFTLDCADGAVGFTKWLVHANTGTGFATTPTTFALPPGFRGTPGSNAEPPFSDLANSVGCGTGFSKPQSRVLDLTGDRLPDLVFTLDCADDAVGYTKWLVFAARCQ